MTYLEQESTRPGSKEILQTDEWLRVNKVMNYLKSKSFFISLDTRKSWIMEKGIKNKVNLINDVYNYIFHLNFLFICIALK